MSKNKNIDQFKEGSADRPGFSDPFSSLLDVFSGMNGELSEMKDSCTSDIKELNTHLNNDFYIIKEVSANSDKITALSNEKSRKNSIDSVIESISNIREKVTQNQNENSETLLSLQKTSSNFALVVDPIKNLALNLTKIQAIIENIQLTNKTYNKNVKGFAAEETHKIEKVISKIKGVCPVLEENIFQLKFHNNKLYERLSNLSDQYTPKISCLLERALDHIELINKQLVSINKTENINHSLLDDTNKRINSLVANIQDFETIFQQFYKYQETFERTLEFNNKSSENGNGHAHSENGFYKNKKILSLIEQRMAQLLIISSKSNKINDQSLKKYSDIISDLSKLYENYSTSLSTEQPYPIAYRQAIELLRDIVDQSTVYLEKYNEFNNDIQAEVKVAKQLYDLFLDVDLMDNSIEQMIIQKITSENFLNNPEDSIAKEAQKILKLYADNHFEKSKFKKIFESSIEELVSTKNIKTSAFFSYKGLPPLEELVDNLTALQIEFKINVLTINEKYQLNFELIKKAKLSSKESSIYLKCFNRFLVSNDELIKEMGIIYDKASMQNEKPSLRKNEMSMEEVKKHYSAKFRNIINDKEVFQEFA